MKHDRRKIFVYLVLTSLLFLIYKNWFLAKEIIGGDWPYYFSENLEGVKLFPSFWATYRGNGLGGINPLLNLYMFQVVLVVPFVRWFGLSWNIVYKFGWFGLFLFLSVISSRRLIRILFRKPLSPWWEALGITIFLTNTYVLMLVGGGQMGVALAYSVAPLVLAQFMELINNSKVKAQKSRNLKKSIIAGLVLSLQVMWDPRLAYITMVGVGVYYLLNLKTTFQNLKLFFINLFLVFGIPSFVILGLHAFWILPIVITSLTGIENLREVYTLTGGVEFLSFADFSNSFSLLHPNWPENIFGKTYFMRPEFLLLPILAYLSLLFINSKRKTQNAKLKFNVLFFSLLGLIGAFLAKGSKPPFGGIYLWLFKYFPGMNMFRDPTKFYLLVALSYSMLIPFSLAQISRRLKKLSTINYQLSTIKPTIKHLVFIIFILYWLFLIRPAWLGQLGGTFKAKEVPTEYVRLKDFIHNQPEFFRTVWVPRQQRFSFGSNIHPAIEASQLFKTSSHSAIISSLKKSEIKELLEELSVKYVIIPYDSLGELFLEDRKYNERQRVNLERELDNVLWLKKVSADKIAIYETPWYQDHFWLEGEGHVSYKMVNSAKYKVSVVIPNPSKLVFSENFSPSWIAATGDEIISSKKTIHNLNSFKLNKIGSYSLEIYFLTQNYLYYGLVISLIALLGVMITLFMLKSK